MEFGEAVRVCVVPSDVEFLIIDESLTIYEHLQATAATAPLKIDAFKT